MTINSRLKTLRYTLKMTQAEFAKAIQISNGYIAEMETEHKKVNDRIIRLISLTFGVDENWLKTGKGDMFYGISVGKLQRLVSLYNELPAQCQDYIMSEIAKIGRRK